MFKLIFVLAVALYASFLIWGQPGQDVAVTTRQSEKPAATTDIVAARDYDRPVILDNTSGREGPATREAVTATVVPDSTAIAEATASASEAPRRIGDPTVISLLQPNAPELQASDDEAPVAGGTLFRVTGSAVNMRSGPSTGNAVVDSLAEGTLAEALSSEIDGWMEIRDVETGLTGFMSTRFLAPA